jgi:hypothetical protein
VFDRDNPDVIDRVKLAGKWSPGFVKFSGHELAAVWDVKKGNGIKGASMTLKEIPPIEFSATFSLPTAEDAAEWNAFRDLIKSTIASSQTKALDIEHPDINELDIASVVMRSLGGRARDGQGGQTITVKFQVYAPPQKKGGSPSGSKSGTGKSPAPLDPNAAAKAELAALLARYKDTQWT